jgi:hypothetical protein
MIEDKKFKLTKGNLNLLHLIQHAILIAKSTYESMKNHQDFENQDVRHNFELICENYIKIHCTFAEMYARGCSLIEPKKMQWLILLNQIDHPIELVIDLEKSHYDCCSMSQTFNGHQFGPVTINFFNVEFIYE